MSGTSPFGPGPRTAALGALLVLLAAPSGALSFEEPVAVAAVDQPSTIAVGPEDPVPATRGDACLYVGAASVGTVERICVDDALAVLSRTTVMDMGPTFSLLGVALDPRSREDGRLFVYASWSPGQAEPFGSHVARATSDDGGASWAVDPFFLAGLPRSSFNHQLNGISFDRHGCLLLAQGGNSNLGYDIGHPESALSGAILRACVLDGLGEVDPETDRVCGAGAIEEACDVAVLAPGFRNSYEAIEHSAGWLLATDNDADQGYRDFCGVEADNFGCPCQEVEIESHGDELDLLLPGRYYGFPNPYRAHPPPSCPGPDCTEDPVQCLAFSTADPPGSGEDPGGRYEPPILELDDDRLLQGFAEMRGAFAERFPGSFCSDWDGDLVFGGFTRIRRADWTDPAAPVFEDAGSTAFHGAAALDVAVGPDGTIYGADYLADRIVALRPVSVGFGPAGRAAARASATGPTGYSFCDASAASLQGSDRPAPPRPVHEAATAAVGSPGGATLWITGFRGSDEVLRWDEVTGSWASSAGVGAPGPAPARPWPLPSVTGSDHRTAVEVDGRVFVIGGIDPPIAEVWELLPDGSGPPVRRADLGCSATEPRCPEAFAVGAVAAAAIGGDVWVAGGFCRASDPACTCDSAGCVPGTTDRAFRYRVAADRWEPLPPLPEAVDHASAAAWGEELWMVGGRRCGGNTDCAARPVTQVFDPRTDAWRPGPPTPEPCAGAGRAIVLDDRLLVVGGEGEGCSGTAIQELDPRTGAWRIAGRLPDEHHGSAPVRLGITRDGTPDRVVLVGGAPGPLHHHVLRRTCEECALRVVPGAGAFPLFRDGFERGDTDRWAGSRTRTPPRLGRFW